MILLDSSFLIAFYNERDVHHAEASRIMDRLVAGEWGLALLPESVFLEVVTVLAIKAGAPLAVAVGDALLSARESEVVACTPLFAEAWATFRSYAETGLSFVDCTLVALARQREVQTIATFDKGLAGVPGIEAIPGE